jgi:hypothetical protein
MRLIIEASVEDDESCATDTMIVGVGNETTVAVERLSWSRHEKKV